LKFLVPALDEVNTGLQVLQMAWDASTLAADKAAIGVLGAAKQQAEGIGWIQKSIMWTADAFQYFRGIVLDTFATITSGLQSVISAMVPFVSQLESFAGLLTGVTKSDISIGFIHAAKSVGDMSKNLHDMSDVLKAQPKPSVAIADGFAKARAEIEKTRAEIAKAPGVDVNKLIPTPGPVMPKGGGHDFASAMTIGSQEAVNTVLRSKFGGQSDKPIDQIKENTKETVVQLAKLNAVMDGGFGLQMVNGF